jgi:DNA-binding LytR/AlgR family response regulator
MQNLFAIIKTIIGGEGNTMLRIAMAEDNPKFAQQLKSQLQRFGEEIQIELQVFAYENGTQLLEAFRGSWDIVLLDIEMPNLNGMDTAQLLRKNDPDVLIMFITNLAQYALKGYEVNAFDYILKPVSYYTLSMKLQLALRQLTQRERSSLLLNQDGELFRVPISSLYYIEIFGHKLCYHTAQGTITINSTHPLSELEQELAPKGFVRCHKGVLVNARYVDHIKGCTITVAGEELPISRNRRKEVLQQLLNCIKGGGSQGC